VSRATDARRHVLQHHREWGRRADIHVGTEREQCNVHVPDVVHSDGELAAWRAWFEAHGIDPDEPHMGHWVERRAHGPQNEIVYLKDGPGYPVEVVVRLSQPPLPFPV
jgi:hypothetical protein